MTDSLFLSPPQSPAPTEHLLERFDALVQEAPDRAALHFLGATRTYAEVAELSHRFRQVFERNGVQPGTRVLLQLQNVPQFVYSVLALWSLDATVVPVSPMYTPREVAKIALDSGAEQIVMSPKVWAAQGEEMAQTIPLDTVYLTAMELAAGEIPDALGALREIVEDIPAPEGVALVGLDPLLEEPLGHPGAVVPLCPAEAQHTAAFVYTSGTTGPPKGAMVTQANLIGAGWPFCEFNGVVSEEDVCLCIAPLVHVTGLGISVGGWLLSGGALVLGCRFHPAQAVADIERYGATWSAGAATAFLAMTVAAEEGDDDVSTFRLAAAGGAPVPGPLLERFEKAMGTPLLPGFGLTESSGSTCSTPRADGARLDPASGAPSSGLPHPGNGVCILDDEGRIVPRGVMGEICLQGPGIVSGYWNAPEATSETFRDGWLHTGDVGQMDEDGWLYVLDRTKNLIVASGYKVWPREVEEVISRIEGVHEVVVLGEPDEYRGESVKAVVSLVAGSTLTGEDIVSVCRSQLAAYKVPRRLVFLDELPKNANGKILRRELV